MSIYSPFNFDEIAIAGLLTSLFTVRIRWRSSTGTEASGIQQVQVYRHHTWFATHIGRHVDACGPFRIRILSAVSHQANDCKWSKGSIMGISYRKGVHRDGNRAFVCVICGILLCGNLDLCLHTISRNMPLNKHKKRIRLRLVCTR